MKDLKIMDLIKMSNLSDIGKMIMANKLLSEVSESEDITDTARHEVRCAIKSIREARRLNRE